MTTELIFDLDNGLREEILAAYIQGVQDALNKLDIEIEFDETSPDLSKYKVQIESPLRCDEV